MKRIALLFVILILSIGGAGQAMAYPMSEQKSSIVEDPALETGLKLILDKPVDASLTPSDLQQLTVVDLSNMGIQSLAGLEYATNLTHLRLYGNELSDLTPVAHLTKLREIDVRNNYITSIDALGELHNLGRLYISNNSVTSIAVVRAFPRLHTFFASGNGITSIAPLEHAHDLKRVEVANNQLTDLSPISGLTKLQSLNVANNRIGSSGSLSELPESLLQLNVAGNDIVDAEPLAHLTKLRSLDVSDNRIERIEAFGALNSLKELNAESNQIYDLRPLAALKKLQSLKLADNRIWDLSPIAKLNLSPGLTDGVQDISASSSAIGSLVPINEIEPAPLTIQHNYLDISSGSQTMQMLNQLNVREQKRSPQGSLQRLTEGSTTAYVGEKPYALDAAPFIDKGRTYVPLRFVSEHLNASVDWHPATEEVIISQGDQVIQWAAGHRQVNVNGKIIVNDAPLLIQNGKAFVPVRFISEQLETTVGYLADSRTILIFANKPPAQQPALQP